MYQNILVFFFLMQLLNILVKVSLSSSRISFQTNHKFRRENMTKTMLIMSSFNYFFRIVAVVVFGFTKFTEVSEVLSRTVVFSNT